MIKKPTVLVSLALKIYCIKMHSNFLIILGQNNFYFNFPEPIILIMNKKLFLAVNFNYI